MIFKTSPIAYCLNTRYKHLYIQTELFYAHQDCSPFIWSKI